jgi:hypothetical protein
MSVYRSSLPIINVPTSSTYRLCHKTSQSDMMQLTKYLMFITFCSFATFANSLSTSCQLRPFSTRLYYENRSFTHCIRNTRLFTRIGAGDDEETMQPRQLVSLGMKRFAELKIEDSIQLFDRADAAVPNDALTPCYLWQRGISLYCADKFQEGSNQVRITLNWS